VSTPPTTTATAVVALTAARGLAYEFDRPGMRVPDRPHRYRPRLRDQSPEATA